MEATISTYITLAVTVAIALLVVLERLGIIAKADKAVPRHKSDPPRTQEQRETYPSGRYELPFITKDLCDEKHRSVTEDIAELRKALQRAIDALNAVSVVIAKLEMRNGASSVNPVRGGAASQR